MCRKEAKEITALLPRLAQQNKTPKVLGIVLEDLPGEISGFRPYLPNATLFLDKERKMYEALGKKKIGLLDLFRPSTISGFFQTKKDSSVSGNMKGDGFTLGGVLVIGNQKQGVLYEWREPNNLNLPPYDQIYEAALKIQDK